MKKLLLAIKPEYAYKIISGEKKYEYRKHLPKESIETIIIYVTTPKKRIIGEVKVIGTYSMSPTALWEKTKKEAGISRAKYREYFRGCSKAHAYKLGEAIRYNSDKELKDYGFMNAPQSFRYIDTNE